MSDMSLLRDKTDSFDFFGEVEKKDQTKSFPVVLENKQEQEISGEHFKKLLDITNYHYRETEKQYLSIAENHNYSQVYLFLNKKPNAFKKEITDAITGTFISYLDDKHAIFWKGKKLPKSVVIAIQSAFRIISGHSYTSFLNVMKAKVYDGFGRDTLKAINYLKLSNVRIDEQVSYFRSLEEPEIVSKVMDENEALFYPSFAKIGFKGLNQYQEFKAFLMSKGLTKKGWKFMCSQSKNYNLRAMRKLHVGIFCMNNGLKDAWLRNTFLSAWLLREELLKKSDVLMKEIENYKGYVKDFSPFEVRSRKMGAAIHYESQQLDHIDDYLKDDYRNFLRNIRNDEEIKPYKEGSKTLFQLVRRSDRWHEENFNKDKGKLEKYDVLPISTFEEDGFKFEQIVNSWDLKKEGDKMHHCVFSYSSRCYEDKYAVYTVTGKSNKKQSKKDVEERATLGLNMSTSVKEFKVDGVIVERKVTSLSFSQMYSYCNDSVSEEMHEAAKVLLKELNKKLQGEKK